MTIKGWVPAVRPRRDLNPSHIELRSKTPFSTLSVQFVATLYFSYHKLCVVFSVMPSVAF